MAVTDFALYIAAIVCFLLASFPAVIKGPIRWEFLAAAFLVCSLL